MTTQINIVSNVLSGEEIHEGLQLEIGNRSDVSVTLIEESDEDMALDPVTAAAIITGGAAILNAVITGLFTLWGKKMESKKATVRIRVDKDGTELEFPAGMSDEEIDKLLERIKTIQSIRHIALIVE